MKAIALDLDGACGLTGILRVPFGMPTVMDVLQGKAIAEDALALVPLGVGAIAGDPRLFQQGFIEQKLADLVEELTSIADLVLIDTPGNDRMPAAGHAVERIVVPTFLDQLSLKAGLQTLRLLEGLNLLDKVGGLLCANTRRKHYSVAANLANALRSMDICYPHELIGSEAWTKAVGAGVAPPKANLENAIEVLNDLLNWKCEPSDLHIFHQVWLAQYEESGEERE